LNYEWLSATATGLFDESRDVRTFTARRLETSLQFDSRWSRVTTLLHRYAFRRVTLDESSLRISRDERDRLGAPVLVALLSQTYLRDTRDDPTDARQGIFSSVDFGVSARQIGSQASFARMVLQNSSYHPFRRRFTLARSFQIGLLAPYGQGREVITERFFAGGGNSHRGFAVNQAGPRDAETGFALGGNALLFNSVEMRFPVWGLNLGGVVFHDMGNVFTRIKDLTLLRHHQHDETDYRYLAHTAGFGLRYRTPVGPVRFDVGYNLNPTRVGTRIGTPEASVQTLSRWQFLVSIGQSF
jgi:outer membrane protein assembly factor BamA